jgi:hypothetical protein
MTTTSQVGRPPTEALAGPEAHGPTYQSYQILHFGFVALPVIAGVDKFLHLLVDWDRYLAPQVSGILGGLAHPFMLVVGAIEVIAGLIVALRPRIGAYIVALWIALIIANLLLSGPFFDIALRDFGLFLAALALGRLATVYDQPGVKGTRATPSRASSTPA